MVGISIHVPTRGTTCSDTPKQIAYGFQSTCPRGARRTPGRRISQPRYFNPRAHEGHDAAAGRKRRPAKFQSTCPRGARPKLLFTHYNEFNFNPRAHEGHDPNCRCARKIIIDFNPRAHEGHDFTILTTCGYIYISIHVPTRGTTRMP